MTDTGFTAPMPRRAFFGTATLSVAGLAALANVATPAFAKAGGSAAQDVGLLNAAIALEHEGIAAYQIAAGSKLLSPGVLAVGIKFQSHHKQHNELLIAAVRRLGGKPVAAKSLDDYAKELNAGSLKSEGDVLQLALKLERGATNAYLGIIGPLHASDLHVLAARIAADEASHTTFLANALGETMSEKAPLFG